MKSLTFNEFIKELERPGTQFVGLETKTDARLRKTGNNLGPVFKKSRLVALVGASYESAVNRQQVREFGRHADFKADALPRPGDTWLIPSKVIQNENGTLYLRTQSTPGMRRKRPAKVAFVNAQGASLSFDTVSPFLPEKSYSMKQEASAEQAKGSKLHGSPGMIDVRDFKFTSIARVRINGKTYKLKGE